MSSEVRTKQGSFLLSATMFSTSTAEARDVTEPYRAVMAAQAVDLSLFGDFESLHIHSLISPSCVYGSTKNSEKARNGLLMGRAGKINVGCRTPLPEL